jgi:hypothetical protein
VSGSESELHAKQGKRDGSTRREPRQEARRQKAGPAWDGSAGAPHLGAGLPHACRSLLARRGIGTSILYVDNREGSPPEGRRHRGLVLAAKVKLPLAPLGFELAIAPSLKLPTADDRRGLGSGEVDGGATLILTKKLTETDGLHFNAGNTFVGRPRGQELRDVLFIGLAGETAVGIVEDRLWVVGNNGPPQHARQVGPRRHPRSKREPASAGWAAEQRADLVATSSQRQRSRAAGRRAGLTRYPRPRWSGLGGSGLAAQEVRPLLLPESVAVARLLAVVAWWGWLRISFARSSSLRAGRQPSRRTRRWAYSTREVIRDIRHDHTSAEQERPLD